MKQQTVVSVLIALLIWDGVMFLFLGTSPVVGAIMNSDSQSSNDTFFA